MRLLSIFCMVCLISLSLVLESFAVDDGSWEFWNTYDLEGKIYDKWKIKFSEEFRLGDEARDFYYQHTDIGVTYLFKKWFDCGINYRQIFEKKDNSWQEENRPHVNGTFKWKVSNLSFSDRNRFEYRIRKGKDDTIQYRNRLMLKWIESKIQPYLADEIFVDFDQGEFNRNRLYLGLAIPLKEYFSFDFYYLWHNTKSSGSWSGINVMGVNVKLAF